MDGSFFARARELERRGRPFATATVVRAERPTSGKPGDRALITEDGVLHGWVGGSCARPLVVEQALACMRDGESRLIRLAPEVEEGSRREGLTDLAMSCFSGGTMEIFVEPHLPAPRLIIVGTLPVARALARLGAVMGYRVTAVDPAGEGATVESGMVEGAEETLAGLEAAAGAIGAATAVVVAGHDDDDAAAAELALGARPAPVYVGLVASRKRAGSIRQHLRRRGVGEDDLARLRSPAGLDLGARRPEEIALSILAEIVQVLRSAPPAAVEVPAAAVEEPSGPEIAAEPDTAVDPVCGMTVKIAGARHRHHHAGTVYHFCCAGCRERFAAEPERYLAASRSG